MWIRLEEQLQGVETRDCSFITAPGRAEGQKAGINIPLPADSDVLGRSRAGRLPWAPVGELKEGTELLFLSVPWSFGE